MTLTHTKVRLSLILSRTLRLLALFFTLLASNLCFAHAEGEDYVFVNFFEQRINGEFQINFEDLSEKLSIVIPETESAALAAVQNTAQQVQEYIAGNFSISTTAGETLKLNFTEAKILPDSTYAQYLFDIEISELPDKLVISHGMFYENDPNHRGLFLIQYNALEDKDYGAEYTALVFNPNNSVQTLDLRRVPGLLDSLGMVWQGMLHIWKGLDHVLFILALILPTVLTRRGSSWQAVDNYKTSLWQLLKIVTVFTLAHSFTLLLAALEIIKVNSRFVESMIALSIILVAANNLSQSVKRGSLWVILFLGLFHGLGFASVMGNLPFRMGDLVKMVIRFNIGVEIGQIVIVLLLFPVLYALRHKPFYNTAILKGGSVILILIASFWFLQRALNLG